MSTTRWRCLAPLIIVCLGMAAMAADWPLTRGGLARWGAVPGDAGPGRSKLVWRWKSGDEGFLSTPAVVGNRVYVASATMGALAESGLIYCFDAETGRKVWATAPPGYRPTFSSPVISGKYLVVGEGLHVTADSRVVCYDISDDTAPKLLWTKQTNSHVECSPVIYKDKVYVGAGDDGYYCIALEPADAKGTAKVVWHAGRERYKDAETGLTVHDGKVYAGLGVGGNALCVLDAETGAEQKRIAVPFPIFAPPTIADGKIFLGMGNGDFINVGRGGEVRCLDLATLDTVWTRELPQTILAAMPVRDGKVYAGCRNGILYVLNAADGTPAGQFSAGAAIVTAPAVSERSVYVFAEDGMLYALDRATLAPQWEFLVGLEPLFISSPTVGNGRVYLGSQCDGFLCIGEPGTPLPTLWSGKANNPWFSPLPDAGAFHWQYPADQMGENTKAIVQAPIAAAGRFIFVPLADGPQLGLACLPVALNQQETPKPVWVYKTARPVFCSPVVLGDTVFIVEGARGSPIDPPRVLHAVDVATGARRWRVDASPMESLLMATTPIGIVSADIENTVTSRDAKTGEVQWSFPLAGYVAQITAHSDLVFVGYSSGVVALDAASGKVRWRIAPAKDYQLLVPVGDLLLGGVLQGRVTARKLADGTAVPGWKLEGEAPIGGIAVAGDRLVYVTAKGNIVVAGAADGKTIRTVPGALPSVAPLVSRGTVLYATKENMMSLDLARADAKPVVWTDVSWLGAPTSPMVLHQGSVYVGMAGWGLARLGKAR